jgi:hypothetical protein
VTRLPLDRLEDALDPYARRLAAFRGQADLQRRVIA